MIFLASFVWITLCIIAIFLSAIVRSKLRFYFTEGTESKPLGLWFTSMLILDLAVFLVGIMVGYNPVYLACVMLLFIQWSYIVTAIDIHREFKSGLGQFDDKGMDWLRMAPIGPSSLNTVLLAVSLGIISFDTILLFVMSFFGIGISLTI